MSIQVTFPGGVSVAAQMGEHKILTDQPVTAGGEGSAPSPFDMFLASIATCAGFYALRFCQQREIDTAGLSVSLTTVRDPEKKRVVTMSIDIETPPGFPEKYVDALKRAVDQCAVKRHIVEPPEFEVNVKL